MESAWGEWHVEDDHFAELEGRSVGPTLPGGQIDLDALEDGPELRWLRIGGGTIVSLALLADFPMLTTLVLDGNARVVDWGSIAGLRQLTSFLVLDRRVVMDDLTPLGSLTGLTRLTLRDSCQITDLAPLANLPGLTRLDLSGSHQITGLGPSRA